MIAFALMLNLCAEPIGCHWLIVEYYTREADCRSAGKEWTAEGGDIVDYKCVVSVKPPDWGKDE